MPLNIKDFFQACNPTHHFDLLTPEGESYYIDFSDVRGGDVVKHLMRTIVLSDGPTSQLFSGHIGCGKTTELYRLKKDLEEKDYHVVYFASSKDLDVGDVDVSDILLAIAKRVSQSLEENNFSVLPFRFKRILKNLVDLLEAEITGFKLNIPGLEEGIGGNIDDETFSLSFGIATINAEAKNSQVIRGLLRQQLEPRIKTIIEVLNKELIDVANEQLKKNNKKGLVVLVDNLDRIDYKRYGMTRPQPEHLFIDRGDQLNSLNCHVVYTVPFALAFCGERERMIHRFGSFLEILPMVPVRNKDGSCYEVGLTSLRKMILARAFPNIKQDKRSNFLNEIFDSRETLDTLCLVSGGHVRSLLVLISHCLRISDPPLTKDLLEKVIETRASELERIIDTKEWSMLRDLYRTKKVRGQEEYRVLIRSLLALEFRHKGEVWSDLNPLLLYLPQMKGEFIPDE